VSHIENLSRSGSSLALEGSPPVSVRKPNLSHVIRATHRRPPSMLSKSDSDDHLAVEGHNP
jgi:hypothetical protein